jgi:hypothetical protein
MKKVLAGMPSGYKKYYEGIPYCTEVGNLYGSTIAGRNWYMHLRKWMNDHGFKQSEWDPCLFTMRSGLDELHVIVYVDDLLMFAPAESKLYDEFDRDFSATFDWTNLSSVPTSMTFCQCASSRKPAR